MSTQSQPDRNPIRVEGHTRVADSIRCGNPDVFPLWRSDRPVRESDRVCEWSVRARELFPTVCDRIGRASSQEVSLLRSRVDPGRSGRDVEASGGGRGGSRLAGAGAEGRAVYARLRF
jgi:hypothetical protein